jgi:8-oxo-dGTP diphosphatase
VSDEASGAAADGARIIRVAAGVLIDTSGRVLLAQRPPGKHLAGMWEFPGGKCETDEDAPQALVRELREELGIEAEPADFLIRVPWRYGEKHLQLDALRVIRWHGTPSSCEGQALRWIEPGLCDRRELAPADRPILQHVHRTMR